MAFTWDEEKNRANAAKHGVSFELASLVFGDPLAVSVPDACESEERWKTIGVVRDIVTLLVVHTVSEPEEGTASEERIRIISARRATRHERRGYEESH